MNIIGDKVYIRAIEQKDLKTLFTWVNDPELWYHLGGWHFPNSYSSMENWFLYMRNDNSNLRFVIETYNGDLIGTLNLIDIDWKNNHAFTGLYIGDKDFRSKGYGTDAIKAIQKYSFNELHFQRLGSHIIEYNNIALAFVLNKCGWKKEGIERNWFFRMNRYWDRILVGITRDDYLKFINKI